VLGTGDVVVDKADMISNFMEYKNIVGYQFKISEKQLQSRIRSHIDMRVLLREGARAGKENP
jgi:hypothetical protein